MIINLLDLIVVRRFAFPVMTRRVMLAGAYAPGRVTQARQVNGQASEEEQITGLPGWRLCGWVGNRHT
jgi:hypothetical protein